MKLTRIIPVVALATLAMLASCKSGNKNDAAANEGAATTTEAATATPAKSAEEIALEKATALKGWIKSIADDIVTIVDAEGNENTTTQLMTDDIGKVITLRASDYESTGFVVDTSKSIYGSVQQGRSSNEGMRYQSA